MRDRNHVAQSRRKALLNVESLARGHTRKAINTLVGIMKDVTAPPQARIAAARALLDRGWGAPPVAAPVSAEPQPILKVVREIVHVNRAPEEIAKDQEPPLIERKNDFGGNEHLREPNGYAVPAVEGTPDAPDPKDQEPPLIERKNDFGGNEPTAASPARRLILCIMGTGGATGPTVIGCIALAKRNGAA